MDARNPLVLFADRALSRSLPLRKRLADRGLRVETTTTAGELLDLVSRSSPDLFVLGDGFDELGSRLLVGLLQERSPGTRIIRAIPRRRPRTADEPDLSVNVLCSVLKRAPVDELMRIITRVLAVAPRAGVPTKPPLVVCIDDDDPFLRSLTRVLSSRGYRVLAYTEPERALEELPLVKPDLVILDVLMSRLDGFEVLGELREFYSERIPVILLSALDGDDDVEEGRRQGAACYLAKPCAAEDLVETMRRVLAHSEVLKEHRSTSGMGPREA